MMRAGAAIVHAVPRPYAERMAPLIAEDLLLLLLDDESGRPIVDSTRLPRVLAGAVLLELALDGYVTPAGADEDVKKGRLAVRQEDAPEDPILARAVEMIRESRRPVKPAAAIEKLDAGMRVAVFERVVDRGWVRESRRPDLPALGGRCRAEGVSRQRPKGDPQARQEHCRR